MDRRDGVPLAPGRRSVWSRTILWESARPRRTLHVRPGNRRSQHHHRAAQARPATAIVAASGNGDGSDNELKAAATSPPTRNWLTPNTADAAPIACGNRLIVRASAFANVKPTPNM